MSLWPNCAPNGNELTGFEQDFKSGEISNVIESTITVYPTSCPNGMAVIMCPGGGYSGLAINHEEHDIVLGAIGKASRMLF